MSPKGIWPSPWVSCPTISSVCSSHSEEIRPMTETTATTQISPSMRDCIQRCTACHNVCTETITYCLQQGGKYVAVGLVRLLQDCAELCATSADLHAAG